MLTIDYTMLQRCVKTLTPLWTGDIITKYSKIRGMSVHYLCDAFARRKNG